MTKKPKTPEDAVDALLAGMPPAEDDRPIRNVVADNEPLSRAIIRSLDLIEAGKLSISLKRFYEDSLRATFKGPRSYDTVKTYVRYFLKRDYRTGKAL